MSGPLLDNKEGKSHITSLDTHTHTHTHTAGPILVNILACIPTPHKEADNKAYVYLKFIGSIIQLAKVHWNHPSVQGDGTNDYFLQVHNSVTIFSMTSCPYLVYRIHETIQPVIISRKVRRCLVFTTYCATTFPPTRTTTTVSLRCGSGANTLTPCKQQTHNLASDSTNMM